MLGLLGESKHTRRYSRLQNFVREGAEKAEIRVTLQNSGWFSFREEKYGSSITFQRFIHRSGRNSFLLLDHEGAVREKDHPARMEGKRILEDFKISIGNPLIILQQEELVVVVAGCLVVKGPGNSSIDVWPNSLM